MKTPIQMLEVFVSDIIENTVLLEEIYKKSNENYETDCSINSLIRSMQKTVDNMNGYIKSHINSVKPCIPVADRNDLTDDIFDVILTAKKLEAVAQTYSEFFLLTRTMTTPRAICQL
ncbi:hypothetical protein [Klebsiella pneumoniae]|uniref:hypothetical protein n=1 Tax=Klebsiella pneumoniae TaxID=573 RepID=UPI000E2B4C1C|nr:hypothetical protein [Klebsiella pneumoniae]QBP07977.1 hypothetical protein [Klebsiella phage ST16-OXA48phi5.3]SXP05475.1 Uncharacterised protein [Klebsiella pneumoniae]SYU11508.1 Uncharacterised protein [Klebsiella pneumoniae]